MTREELKATLPSEWFENEDEVISQSFEQYYAYVTHHNLQPNEDAFTGIVNANIEEGYSCSYQMSCYY